MSKKLQPVEYIAVRIYKDRLERIWIHHVLDSQPAPLPFDYLYLFTGKYGLVAVSIVGKFTDNQLRATIHKLIASDFASHELKLKEYRIDKGDEIIVKTLKGVQK